MYLKIIFIGIAFCILLSCEKNFNFSGDKLKLEITQKVVLNRFDFDISIDFWNTKLSYVFLTQIKTNSEKSVEIQPYKFYIYLDHLDTSLSGNLLDNRIQVIDSIGNDIEVMSSILESDTVLNNLRIMNAVWELNSNPTIEFEFKCENEILKTNRVDLIYNKSNFKNFLVKLRMGEASLNDFINMVKLQ